LHTVSPETPEQHALRFPKLTDAQVSQLAPSSAQRRVNAHEILFDQGTAGHGVYIVLTGSIEIVESRMELNLFSAFWVPANSPAR
jgi:signal-transduction protein with cAMP-binding, CBS, and nucleotidyltransferase domain